MKRIAVDLAKSVYQVAESVRAGQVSQRRRLNREVFARYVQEQTEPVEWVMEACGTAHYWGRVAQSLVLIGDRPRFLILWLLNRGLSPITRLRELQNGQGKAPITGRIYECNRTDDRVGKSFAHCLWGESIYAC